MSAWNNKFIDGGYTVAIEGAPVKCIAALFKLTGTYQAKLKEWTWDMETSRTDGNEQQNKSLPWKKKE